MDLNLGGRSVLITGGSKGIGFAVAETMAAEGCRVHLSARGEEGLKTAADSLHQRFDVDVDIHPGDMSNTEGAEALAAACDGIDILINNAGGTPGGTLGSIDPKKWRQGWDLKVFGTIDLTRAVFGSMCERGSGVIVNIIGNSADVPDADHICASTANSSLVMLTRALGGVGPDSGVRVVGVNPGLVGTDRMIMLMEPKAEDEFGDKSRWGELLSHLPYGRPADTQEIADVVAFLASDRAAYVSGDVLTIDGGYSKRHNCF